MHIFVSSLPYVLIAVCVCLFVWVMRVFNQRDAQKVKKLESLGVVDAADRVMISASFRTAVYGCVCGFLLLMQAVAVVSNERHSQSVFYVFTALFVAPLLATLLALRLRPS